MNVRLDIGDRLCKDKKRWKKSSVQQPAQMTFLRGMFPVV
jgi:hypothetical protein